MSTMTDEKNNRTDMPELADHSLPRRQFWLSRWIRSPWLRVLLLVVVYVAVQPPKTGLGIDLCMMHRFTGAPCPGCGMTRSGANMLRGNFVRAWQFHPFGYLFIPVLFALAGISLLPSAVRGVLAAHCDRHVRVLRLLNGLLLAGFLIFGVARFVLVLAGWIEFG